LRPSFAEPLHLLQMLNRVLQRRLGAPFHHLVAFFSVVLGTAGTVPHAVATAGGPTVKDLVEFTSIVHDQDADRLNEQVSPDGTRAFLVTRRGDVARDRTRYEILLLDLDPVRLGAGRQLAPQTLLTIESSQDNDSIDPVVREPRWAGASALVFLARIDDAPRQVFKLDVTTRRLEQLTHEGRGIESFAISDDLRRIVYTSFDPNPAMRPGARSVVVGNSSFWDVKFGQNDVRAQKRRYLYFTSESGSRLPGRQLGESVPENGAGPRVDISPDGRWAVLPVPAPERQMEWARVYPWVKQLTARFGPAMSIDPLGYFTSPGSYIPRRMIAYRLSDGGAQMIVDAPDDAATAFSQMRSDRLWQRGDTSVILAGVLLPQGAAPGVRDGASHVIEYWPDSSRWKVVAVLEHRLDNAYAVSGEQAGFVMIDGVQRRRFARRDGGGWRELSASGATNAEGANGSPAFSGWRLRVDQQLNQPADVVAVGPTGQVVRMTHLNPQYSLEDWGAMRSYAWADARNRRWVGGLMVPRGFDRSRRYPLVIQTYGYSPNRFYLDGSNVADGYTSGFAGRAFLREGILVLALPTRPIGQGPTEIRDRIPAFMDATESAIRSLVADGTVDPDRVGILGFSMTGEHVLNLVTFSDAPIRAASLLDGDANTLFSMTVSYGARDGILSKKEATNGGGPYGASLERWVRVDPALHTHCIRAAMRIETYGPWVLNNWDIYGLLRRQYKPAEMVVLPGGTHNLGSSSDRMISLQGNVDWYRFWLKGEERTEPFLPEETAESLRKQYVRWREMAELKKVDDRKPRCSDVSPW
jgi:dipeptidyl aminopeptidase/acylaminoacyl peptidase